MDTPLITVIIPVYMVSNYLEKCIESLLVQTYNNLEIILVNDGSTDNCISICEKYVELDSRVILLSQENKGVSVARNLALDIARGEYVGFVDADDWVEPTMYESLYNLIYKNGCKIAMCNFFLHQSGQSTVNKLSVQIPEEGIITIEDMYNYILTPESFGGFVWNKLYHRCFFEGENSIRFIPEFTLCEDRIFNVEVFAKSDKIAYTSLSYYHYLIRKNSATRKHNVKPEIGLNARKMTIQALPEKYASYDRAVYIKILAQAAYHTYAEKNYILHKTIRNELKNIYSDYIKDFKKNRMYFSKRERMLVYFTNFNFPMSYKMWCLLRKFSVTKTLFPDNNIPPI